MVVPSGQESGIIDFPRSASVIVTFTAIFFALPDLIPDHSPAGGMLNSSPFAAKRLQLLRVQIPRAAAINFGVRATSSLC